MVQSPFKLFEPYGSNDKNIFFGRDAEIYALYNLLEQTRLVLMYGASGTGKTSLIHAGLPKIFMQTDWFLISVKRRDNINASFRDELSKFSTLTDRNDLSKSINAVFETSWIPIYLVFDQFEELFTLGNHEERVQFFTDLQTLLDTPLPCKIILSMREEYIGHLYEYEPFLPTLFDKRFRVEPMKDATVKAVINQMCAAGGVTLADGQTTADQIFEQVKEGKQAAHLPYLQVYLHYLYENALQTLEKPLFTEGGITTVGQLGNVLKRFIETQLEAARLQFASLGLPDDFAARLLDEFATDEGTKQAHKTTDLAKRLDTEGGKVKAALHYFSEAKLLRPDEDDVERYEPVHDVVAKQIHELRSVEDKEFKVFLRQLQLSYEAWVRDEKKTQRLLNDLDLNKVSVYEERLKKLPNYETELADLIEKSRVQITYFKQRERQRRNILRGITTAALVGLLLALGLAFWAWIQSEKANKFSRMAKNSALYSIYKESDPTLAYNIARYNNYNHYGTEITRVNLEQSVTDFVNRKIMFYKYFIKGNWTGMFVPDAHLSPDNEFVGLAQRDTLFFYSLIDSKQKYSIPNKKKISNNFFSFEFLQDKKHVIFVEPEYDTTNYFRGTIRIVEFKTGKEIFSKPLETPYVYAYKNQNLLYAFWDNEEKIIYSPKKNIIELWDIKANRLLKKFESKEGATIKFIRPLGEKFLTLDSLGQINIWDIEKARLVKSIKTQIKDALVAKMTFNSEKLIITEYKAITIVDINTGTLKQLATQGDHLVFTLPNDSLIVVGLQHIVNIKTGTATKIFSEKEKYISAIAALPNQNKILLASMGNILLYDIDKKIISDTIAKDLDFLQYIFISKDGSLVASLQRSGIAVWRIDKKRNLIELQPEKYFYNQKIAFSFDRRFIAGYFTKSRGSMYSSGVTILYTDNTKKHPIAEEPITETDSIGVWDVQNGELKAKFSHPSELISISFTPDNNYLLTICREDTLRTWDYKTGKLIKKEKVQPHSQKLYYSSDGKYFGFYPNYDTVYIQNTQTGNILTKLSIKNVNFGKFEVSASQKYVFNKTNYDNISSSDLEFWNVQTGKFFNYSLRDEVTPSPDEKHFCIVKNGNLIIAGLENRVIESEAFLTSYRVAGILYTNDAKNIIYLDERYRLYVVNPQTGNAFMTFLNSKEPDLVLNWPGNNRIVCVYKDAVQIWDMEKDNLELQGYEYSLEQLWEIGVQLEAQDLKKIGKQSNKK